MDYKRIWPPEEKNKFKFDLEYLPEIIESVLYELNFQFDSGELSTNNPEYRILNPLNNDGFDVDGDDVSIYTNRDFELTLRVPIVVYDEADGYPIELIARVTPKRFDTNKQPWEELFNVSFIVYEKINYD